MLLAAVAGIFMLANSAEARPWTVIYQTDLSADGAEARADRTQITTMPAPTYYFNTVFHTTPKDGFKLYKDSDVPNGAWVATNKSFIRAGFNNGPCANTIPVPISGDFELHDATTNDSVLVSHANGVLDTNGNGIRDGVEMYPVVVDALYPQSTVGVPRSRAYGFTSLIGTPVAVHFLTYEPGTFAAQGIPASQGYVTASFAVTGDPGVPTPGFVTDACTLFNSTNKHFGRSRDNINTTCCDESGKELSKNPHNEGTYILGNYSLPVRDLDDDGVENSLDTCPYIENNDDSTPGVPPYDPASGSERTSNGPDGDGIDSACDPNPGFNDGGASGDADGDGFKNRQDNCPLVYNPSQLETEANNAGAFGSDRGTKTDSIGDACDLNPAQADGHYHTTANTGFPNTSGPQCDFNVTCGDLCTGPYVIVLQVTAGVDESSPPVGCTTFNPVGCTATTTGDPCTTPASPPKVETIVTIGPRHDIYRKGLEGSSSADPAPITKVYKLTVKNNGKVTEKIQVALKVQAVTGDCTVNGGDPSQTQMVETADVLPGKEVKVPFSVTFDGCSLSTGHDTTSSDYLITADACHSGDPPPYGFFGSTTDPCPGVNDGDGDADVKNDQPKTKNVNDHDR